MKIINEQAKLALGDDKYREAKRKAVAFLQYRFDRQWLDRNTVITQEGGWDSLVTTALAYIVAADGDIDEGLKQYGSVLAAEYEADDTVSLDAGIHHEEVVNDSPQLSLPEHYLEALRSDNQREIARLLYEDNFKQSEIADLLGVTRQAVHEVVKKIHSRLREVGEDA